MRPLTEEETKAVFESELSGKASTWRSIADETELANYIGKNLVHLIDRDEDDAYCFRLNRDRSVIANQRASVALALRDRSGSNWRDRRTVGIEERTARPGYHELSQSFRTELTLAECTICPSTCSTTPPPSPAQISSPSVHVSANLARPASSSWVLPRWIGWPSTQSTR